MARDSKGKGRRVDEVVEEDEEDEVPSNTQNTAMEVDGDEDEAEAGESSSGNKGTGKGKYDPEQGEAASCKLQWKRRVY